jgi:hypothetical protein
MLRLRTPLIDVHDLPAAIRSTSRLSSSGVQRILGITQLLSSFHARNVSKVGGNQIVGTSASANIDLGCGGTYQITIAIERVQKAQLIGARIWLNSPQCVFAYKK